MAKSLFNVEFKFYYKNMSTTLPVPSEDLSFRKTANIEFNENLIGRTKSKATSSGLKRFEINSFFPEEWIFGSNIFLPNSLTNITTSVGNTAPVSYPKEYVKFFEQIMNNVESVQLVVTGLEAVDTLEVFIEDFSWGYRFGTEDIYYTLTLVEAEPFDVTTIIKKPNPVAPPVTKPSVGNVAVGDRVRVKGNYYYTSYGARPTYVFKSGFIGKVHRIIKVSSRPYPIHITNTSGGWYGWIKKNQIIEVLR